MIKQFSLKQFLSSALQLLEFVLLITIFVIYNSYKRLYAKLLKNRRIDPPLARGYRFLIQVLDRNRVGTISRINLIEMSLKNMATKRTRTLITMGGMALGIGLIVLLVSIGYGLEHLVINRVARLEELRQADIVPGLTDELALTDQTISNFQQISGISEVIPVISAVGKVNYNNSQSDMAVYGVTSNYLEESAIKPSHGKIFESNDLTANIYSADPPSPESRPAGGGAIFN